MSELASIARQMVAPGKGILAADESSPTIKKRFDSIGVESTEDVRRGYREMLFTTAGAEQYVSGVILFDETLRQSAADGTPFPKLLTDKGILPGIKVDKGAKPLPFAKGETVTEGLDGLRERVAEYRELGARFGTAHQVGGESARVRRCVGAAVDGVLDPLRAAGCLLDRVALAPGSALDHVRCLHDLVKRLLHHAERVREKSTRSPELTRE